MRIQSKKHTKITAVLVSILIAVLILGGIYLLYLVNVPKLRIVGIDPSSNSTTKKIETNTPLDSWLYIPKIDVNVSYAPNENALSNGAWWRKPQNGNPKDGGNFVLAGHRFVMSFLPGSVTERSPFYSIDQLSEGDEIYVDYHKVRYKYKVSRKHTVKPNAVEIESRTDESQLTLYSCTLGGSNDGREVIVAKLVE